MNYTSIKGAVIKKGVLKSVCYIIFLLTSFCVSAQDTTIEGKNVKTLFNLSQPPARPKAFGFITKVPKDLLQISENSFRKNNLKNLVAVLGSSAILILADQKIYEGVRGFSNDIHLDPDEKNSIVWLVKTGNKETVLLKAPQNLNTALYNFGQGFTTILIAAGFYVQGKITKNNTSLQTASDLTESFITLGVATQLLKYVTGREDPGASTRNGGAWRPFPKLSSFQNKKSRYDAFPSGHLSTLVAAVTILANDYPQSKWIRPVGYTLSALTGFAMVNNGVHWAGDYPLAIALGYLTGNIITSRHRQPVNRKYPGF